MRTVINLLLAILDEIRGCLYDLMGPPCESYEWEE